MPRKVLAEFKVERLEVLDADGNVDEDLKPNLPPVQLKNLYYWMVLARTFDETAVSLQREGRMLTYGSLRGQEAAQVPVAFAMEKQDWLVPSFREHGAMLLRGAPPKNLYMYWGGDERGHAFPEGVNILPVAIPVATQVVHTMGIAWAFKMRKEPACAVGFFGDGGTSEGDFHEGLNFAGVFKVPALFVCQNNQWAISVPRSRQTAARTIAQKAIAYGIPGLQVDGNDPLAMYAAAKEALDRARAGEGPTLIEAFTYRMEHHTTADDWTRYRDPKEVEEWQRKDPLERLRKHLARIGHWDDDEERKLRARVREEIDKAVREYEAEAPPIPHDMFEFAYAEKTEVLKEQWEHLWKQLQQQPPAEPR
jgi:pyruvate dehydrogenase E1 component alpha subunit